MTDSVHSGFAVVYQWRVKAGMDAQFRQAWEELTVLLRRERGARGARLHRTDYGTLVAYAQWPDQATWERSCSFHKLDEEISKRLLDVVEETWPPMLLTPVCDHIVAENVQNPLPNAITH